MIDLNKIRNPKTLEAMTRTINEFLNYERTELVEVYEKEYCYDEGDLEADLEAARDLLVKVEHRANSLGRHLATVTEDIPQTPAVVSSSVCIEAGGN